MEQVSPARVRSPRIIDVPLAIAGYISIAGVRSYVIVFPAARTVIVSVPAAENKPKLYFDIIYRIRFVIHRCSA